MKKLILIAGLLVSFSSLAEKYSTYADAPGTAQGFATSVVSYSPGPGASGAATTQSRVLGAPDDANDGTATKSLSLGKKGNVVVQVGPNALKADGTSANDLYVFESSWWESFDVYVSTDNVNFTKLTPTTQSITTTGKGSWLGFNLDGQVDPYQAYPFIKVVDTSNSTSTVAGTDGADIDAVVIMSAVTPAGNNVFYDTDSDGGSVYNLYQDADTGAVGVKVIRADKSVYYIPFSTDNSLDPVALSVQTDFNSDSVNDVEVLVKRKADNAQLNIVRSTIGTLIETIDNSVVK